MRWTERQRAMLAEIGIRLWWPDQAAATADAVGVKPAELASTEPTPKVLRSDAEPTLDAAAPARAALDWAALAELAAAAAPCPLCGGRARLRLGSGHRQADWMVVADAPDGSDERAGAEPFAGKAGKLLDNMLRAIGLTRAEGPAARQIYLTEAGRCAPAVGASPAAISPLCCGPLLARELQLVQPRLVLALGRVTAQGLLGTSDAIGRLRGKVHRHHGTPLIVSFAPSYLLRHPEDKAGAWDDLCLARDALGEPNSG